MLNTVLYYPEDDGGGEAVEVAEVEESAPEPEGPLTLADDARVAWDGLDSPLTGKDIREGWLRQQDYTQKTQEIAKQRKEWEQKASEGERAMQYARELERVLQQQHASAQPKEDALAETWAAMEQQGNIPTSREVKQIVDHIQKNGIGKVQGEVQELKQQLQYVLQDYMQTKQGLGSLYQDRSTQRRESALETALREAKVSDSERELAMEFAHDMLGSFEPGQGETIDDLLQQFPSMFSKRWGAIMGLSRARDKADLQKAKDESLPRSGGNATPSKKMKPGDETPAEIAAKFLRK